MGGYLTQTVGVRYGFVLTAALGATALTLCALFLPETAHPLLQSNNDTQRTGLIKFWNKGTKGVIGNERVGISALLMGPQAREAALRPWVLLTRSLICLIMSFYGAL